jgi:uncharacterized membrane protein YccC
MQTSFSERTAYNMDAFLNELFSKRSSGATDEQILLCMSGMSVTEQESVLADLATMERLTADNEQLRADNEQLRADNEQLNARIQVFERNEAALKDVRAALQNVGYDYPDSATLSMHIRRAIYQPVPECA